MTGEPGARVGWLDCASGVSGDMLLGALHEVVDLTPLSQVLAATPELGAVLSISSVRRGELAASRVQVEARDASDAPPRRLGDVVALIGTMPLREAVRERAVRVFHRLAEAEAAVHGVDPADVHFHEVGAVDSIVDVVGVCLGLDLLALDRLVVSPIALGGGTTSAAHGTLPVPTPAALRLLAGASLQAHGGPDDHELATPTGIALLAELADTCGDMPAMRVSAVGVGAGTRDDPARPNVVRLVVGDTVATEPTGATWMLIEANVDDLDPRLWPGVLESLLDAGAVDAWLTPILMKKGRPAHTLTALVAEPAIDVVRRAMFEHSTTIGVRTTVVGKHALDRKSIHVDIDGQSIAVKVALLDGEAVNVSPEWEDVAAAARALGRPAKTVLAAALAAAQQVLG